MLRAILLAVLAIFLLTVFRMIAGVFTKGVAEMMNPARPEGAQKPPPAHESASQSTETLKRDPVCGTFVPATSVFRKTVRGEVTCFCSADCRDRYTA
ncbi:MAG: hypothetical protein H7039_10315 [Bryobacteraceae bacterium]|nr:hypothetical protein [Bryobacteraceae bacterium]